MDNAAHSTRNGEIEFLRFCASVTIFFFHLGYIPNGFFAVPAFFILSGYYMAKSMRKIQCEEYCASRKNKNSFGSFFMHKIGSFYVELFITVCIALPIFLLKCKCLQECIDVMFNAFLNDLLLLRMSGITNPDPGVCLPDWYLSSMMIAICVFYPIIHKKSNTVIVTVITILSLSILRYVYLGEFADTSHIMKMPFILPNENFRAIGMMGFGIIIHDLGLKCRELQYNAIIMRCIRIVGLLSIFGCLLYVLTDAHVRILFACILFGIYMLTISIQGNRAHLLNCSICNFLGKLSLTIYLVHWPAKTAANYMLASYNLQGHHCYLLLLSAIITALFVLIVILLKRPLIGIYKAIKQQVTVSHA